MFLGLELRSFLPNESQFIGFLPYCDLAKAVPAYSPKKPMPHTANSTIFFIRYFLMRFI